MSGDVLFVDKDESNCLAIGKVCVKTNYMDVIQEPISVDMDGKKYEIFMKEMATWEPEVGKEGSFYDSENSSRQSDEDKQDLM
uniref:RNA-directed DNA polymerase, eukaryota n=1 Tax=Tanacetum cinerariifolium TaxID=118510 RepID=A0A699TNY1_TANCI|nr:RNA-directed DNA polymerase, eukaryota [Tanacetum cinerariifolium]